MTISSTFSTASSTTPSPAVAAENMDAAFESALLPVTTGDSYPVVGPPKRLQPVRFASGLLLSTTGMGIILVVGVQMVEVQQLAGNFALALVAISVLSGVTLLGGGFGLMATASSGFDESEFDRLMKAGNIASATMPEDCRSDSDSRCPGLHRQLNN